MATEVLVKEIRVGEQQPIHRGFVIGATIAIGAAIVVPLWAFFYVKVVFPPMVGDDSGVTTVNAPMKINLVANDADADGSLDLASVTLLKTPAHGIASVEPTSGLCTYAPELDFVGHDKFSYQIHDNGGAPSNIGFVTVDVVRPSVR
jgi:Big-like domain-containing protein